MDCFRSISDFLRNCVTFFFLGIDEMPLDSRWTSSGILDGIPHKILDKMHHSYPNCLLRCHTGAPGFLNGTLYVSDEMHPGFPDEMTPGVLNRMLHGITDEILFKMSDKIYPRNPDGMLSGILEGMSPEISKECSIDCRLWFSPK